LPDYRLIGGSVFYRRVRGEGHLDGVADRGAQAAGGGCPGRERARGAEPGTRVEGERGGAPIGARRASRP